MIPIWRRYQRPFVRSVVCAGLVTLMVGNAGFWQIHKIAVPETPQSPVEAVPIQQEERTQSAHSRVTIYTVLPGDSLEIIARKHAIDVDTIMGANPELSRDVIQPGQQVHILSERGILHIVKQGQTLWSIARQYGLDLQKVRTDNPEIETASLQPGQKLFIRGAKPRTEGDVSRGSMDPSFRWPAQGAISSPFGYRWGALHTGIDIAADSGEPIYAARSGRVTYAGWKGGYGLAVVIDHGRGWETLYGHTSTLFVSTGDIVDGGQHIAAVGNTGYSTGPHLHFEVRNQGIPQNPTQYLP